MKAKKIYVIAGVKTIRTEISFYVRKDTIEAVMAQLSPSRQVGDPLTTVHEEVVPHDGTAKAIKAYCKRFIEARGYAHYALPLAKRYWEKV
jgi:hypothetical protein